ncbi:MAG: hypothetical protein IT249_08035 [Chitinophagaceae bacterium]|nr:hypothetical protein [Chitinophagaceae bacterium]
MSKLKNTNVEFKQIVTLIQEAQNRAFHKVSEELVLLYFKVRRFVSEKVTMGKWGENAVQELANYIQAQMPNLTGFNCRGLYRMKQFFEVYSDNKFVSTVMTLLQTIGDRQNKIVSTLPTLLEKDKKGFQAR